MKLLQLAGLVVAAVITLVVLARRLLAPGTATRLGNAAAAVVFASLFVAESGVLVTSWSTLGPVRRLAFAGVALLLGSFTAQHLLRVRRGGTSAASHRRRPPSL